VPAAADEQWSDFHRFWMDGIVTARLIVNVDPNVPPSVMAPLLFARAPPRCPGAGSKIEPRAMGFSELRDCRWDCQSRFRENAIRDNTWLPLFTLLIGDLAALLSSDSA
jgi:hypothetical protein